eukprot:m.168729 g.168729  ORF g.168729 m.168729 type:complete len:726 (-) comp16655_c1_seq1:414-2591(-)
MAWFWCAVFGLLGAALVTADQNTSHIKYVHVIQTCHLDVGFASTAAGELANYHKYFLEAIATADAYNKTPGANGEGMVFTTHPYLVSLLLDCPPGMGFACPSAADQATIRRGLETGILVMQAFPHNSETATLSTALFQEALKLGQRLARNLSVPAPTVMTQRDVPAATRGMLALLKANGVIGFSSGVNTASLPPDVPRAFVWRDEATNSDILTTVHPFGYGGIGVQDCIVLDYLDHALCPDYNGDNAGPYDTTKIAQDWATLMQEFPNAQVRPSTFDAFFSELQSVQDQLPVVTDEIADTWIYGVPSDPLKNSQYRTMSRVWAQCVSEGRCQLDDPVLQNFTRLLLKNPEHTWGGDVKKVLHDETNWLNADFHPQQYTASNFLEITSSWHEQRDWGLTYALQALELKQHPLAAEIRAALAENDASGSPSLDGYTEVKPSQVFSFEDASFQVDAATGALVHLQRAGHPDWASSTNPLALFEYKVHTTDEYNYFFNTYIQRVDGKIPSFAPKDFGKPGLYNASAIAQLISANPVLSNIYLKESSSGVSVLVKSSLNNATLVSDYGAPQAIWTNYTLVSVEGAAQLLVAVRLLNKTATRLPESMWVRFEPEVGAASDATWRMAKLTGEVSPWDVHLNGSRHLHAVSEDGLTCQESTQSATLQIQPLDTPVVSIGDTNPFPTPSGAWEPSNSKGAHSCLFDNIWGTNYVMWYPYDPKDADIQYRWQLVF